MPTPFIISIPTDDCLTQYNLVREELISFLHDSRLLGGPTDGLLSRLLAANPHQKRNE